ncbi:hypothetical protein [Undibacterium sp. TJN19]|uniref:hypothetical protein n=1 Tax=Undibacterium sp. TJN19 TaxID=3413055 RepID=UPI003BF4261C
MRTIAGLFFSIRLVLGVLDLLLVTSGNANASADEKPVIFFNITWPKTTTGIEWTHLRIPYAFQVNTVWNLPLLAETQLFQQKQGKMTAPAYANFSVSAFWPDMAPLDEMKWLAQPAHDKSLQVYALLQLSAIDIYDGVNVNRLQYDFKTFSVNLNNVCYYPKVEKNERGLIDAAICSNREQVDAKPARYGLERIGIDFSHYPVIPRSQYGDIFKDDVYFSYDEKKNLNTVIRCTAEEAEASGNGLQAPAPAFCEQGFIFKPLNAKVTLSYQRIHLKDWVAMQAVWEKLLQSFILRPEY